MKKVLLTFLLALLTFSFFSTFLILKKQNLNKEVIIPKGASSFQIAEILEKEGVIPNKYLFFLYA
ncbi:MAG: endolytic transglycosylase MltG, partial [Sulfurihydrogenibium sp.]